ncbi:MAG TPA: SGNH/GDSL hydrolase family protein [Solirubrobacterales bacterium]
MPRPSPRSIVSLLTLTALFTVLGATLAAGSCGEEPAPTTLTTSLSGEAKSGEEITVNEGTKVKDQATLSGENSAIATGTIKYFVYSDSKCEKLVTKAGETAFSEGKVPASEEKTLEAGAVYYWQAEYTGDAVNAASKSTCGKEVLTIKAATSLTTSLSGEGKSGEEITVLEGTKVKDTATLSGTKASTATGKAKYKIYSDSKCETLVAEAGEVTVSGTSVPASEEKTLEAGAVYYWQAEYAGDSLHQASKSTCGKEVLTIKALVTISTLLAGLGAEGDETVEGEEISVPAGTAVVDTATLSGANASKATGSLQYLVYSDSKCEELFAEAGEVEVEGTAVPPSEEQALEEGAYYWQAVYSGDSLHKESISTCGDEIARAIAPTSLSTELTGEGEEGEEIEVTEGTAVSDSAKLTGKNASEATGNVEYSVYSDISCEELVTKAGKVTVSGGSVPASTPQTLEPGVYFWKAVYSGDSSNYESRSPCGSEILVVTPRITTELTGGERSGEAIEVPEGILVSDSATLHGSKAAEATGTVEYFAYPDEECEELPIEAGEVEVEGASVPPSEELELEQGTYYWVAEYSGDEENPPVTSACGAEMVVVVTPTTLTTTLSGAEEEGAEIEVEEGTAVSDSAELSGANAATAEGAISYVVYEDSECTEVAALAGGGDVDEGEVPASDEVDLPAGTYYWQASYTGDGVNQASTDACGEETAVVTTGITTMLSSGEASGTELEVDIGAGVTDAATLHGPNAEEATGYVEYFVYGDNQCEELVTSAGKVTVGGASVPSSSEVKLENPGVYYWQAVYSGDEENPPATSACGVEILLVADQPKDVYAAIGDSFSAGQGLAADGGIYYQATDEKPQPPIHSENWCHRSDLAWPALIAEERFGAGVVAEETVFDQAPANFIFRACSGAETKNLWAGAADGGQYDEWISKPAKEWIKPTPAQNLWLLTPGGKANGKANQDISTVTLTVGGNDAGFSKIALACLQWAPDPLFKPAACQAEIATREKGFGAIQAKILVVLEDIQAKAPNARIAVPLYPSMLFLNGGKDIDVAPESPGVTFINDTAPGTDGLTAAASIERFIDRLNLMVKAAVKEAENKKINVRTVEGTYQAFDKHRFGEAGFLWVNGIVLITPKTSFKESFHPNICGHLALAHLVYRALYPGKGPPPSC